MAVVHAQHTCYDLYMSSALLTLRQLAFVEAYSLGGSATSAARRAGYGERGAGVAATRLLKNANVQAALAARRAENAEQFALSREAVIEELQGAIAVAKEKGDPMAQIAGWREIAKMCGFYAPEKMRVAVTEEGRAMAARLEAMSDAELLALIRRSAA